MADPTLTPCNQFSPSRTFPAPLYVYFDSHEAGINYQQVPLDRARYNLEHAVVTAPYDGVVERVGVAMGDRIGAGQEVAVTRSVALFR